MDEMIYVAMTGARQTEVAQTINSNNLANVSTTAFRADLHAFSNVPIDGPGIGSRVNAVVDNYDTDFTQGAIQNTGRSLDVAIQGDGFFAVQTEDGSESGWIGVVPEPSTGMLMALGVVTLAWRRR